MYIFFFFIMLSINMLSIILHDACLHHSNACDIDRNACTLLFNLYKQYHYIVFLLILLEHYAIDNRHQELSHGTCYKAISTHSDE